MTVSEDQFSRRRLAQKLRERRHNIIAALRDGKYSGLPRENRFEDEPSKFDERIGNWIDLLAGCLNGTAGYDALLASQILIEIHRPEQEPESNRRALLRSLDAAWVDLASAVNLDAVDLEQLKLAFDDIVLGIRTEPRAHVKTLLIGDCLMGEVGGLAGNMLARKAISFDAFPLNARSAADLERQVSKLEDQTLAAVFFSPFSHARLPEIDVFLNPRKGLLPAGEIDALIDSVVVQTEELLTYLLQRFECPIYVHNAGLVARATTKLRGVARNAMTIRLRERAKKRINSWLAGFAAAQDSTGRRQLRIIDETAIVSNLGGAGAGRYVYASDFQHSTMLSVSLASEYASRIEMLATLFGRKLVICDLDHTLWHGVIGEGSVDHFSGRQKVLAKLKERSGVVLSIASKNDPTKVDFTGGLLSLEDFVAPQVSWGPKVQSILKIREQLNLQYRHMVFVDDRPDERAFVADAYPEILTLDATDDEIWKLLAHWADLVAGSSDLDRTELYKQQVKRDDFVAENKVKALTADVIAKLGLKTEVRTVRAADVDRFVELVNRTNQWNLTGARTTAATIRAEVDAPDTLLLLASARDRFGEMGDVCAARASIADEQATISAFVLSCRVFGYGVEFQMLNTIRQMASNRGAKRLLGRFLETTQNRMAKDMYADDGFEAQPDGWFAASLTEPV